MSKLPNRNKGFAFVIQNTDPSILGLGGGALGYHGIRNSIAIEFDIELDDWTLDPDSNHVSVHTEGMRQNRAHEDGSIGRASPGFSMSDGAIHTATIAYTPGALTIYLDDRGEPLLEIPLDMAQTLSLDSGKAWVGFTAGANDEAEPHDIFILSWSFSWREQK